MLNDHLSISAKCADIIRRIVIQYADQEVIIVLSKELYDLLSKYFIEYNGVTMIFGIPVIQGLEKEVEWTSNVQARLYVVFNNTIDQVLSWYEEWRKNGWVLQKRE